MTEKQSKLEEEKRNEFWCALQMKTWDRKKAHKYSRRQQNVKCAWKRAAAKRLFALQHFITEFLCGKRVGQRYKFRWGYAVFFCFLRHKLALKLELHGKLHATFYYLISILSDDFHFSKYPDFILGLHNLRMTAIVIVFPFVKPLFGEWGREGLDSRETKFCFRAFGQKKDKKKN